MPPTGFAFATVIVSMPSDALVGPVLAGRSAARSAGRPGASPVVTVLVGVVGEPSSPSSPLKTTNNTIATPIVASTTAALVVLDRIVPPPVGCGRKCPHRPSVGARGGEA